MPPRMVAHGKGRVACPFLPPGCRILVQTRLASPIEHSRAFGCPTGVEREYGVS